MLYINQQNKYLATTALFSFVIKYRLYIFINSKIYIQKGNLFFIQI